MPGRWLAARGPPRASRSGWVNPLQQGLQGRNLAREAQEMLAAAGTGKGGAETAARPKQGGAPGGSLGKGARPGDRVEVASRGGKAGRRAREEEGDRRLPPPGLPASSRRARPRRPLASLSLSRSAGVRAGLGGPGGARGRAPLSHFSSLPPSSRGRRGRPSQ